MKFTDIRIGPLGVQLAKPYHCSQGVREEFSVNLPEVIAEDGTIGDGESTVAPNQTAQFHASFTRGITNCAGRVIAREPFRISINQIMCHLLKHRALTSEQGWLALSTNDGLGFKRDETVTTQSEQRYREPRSAAS